MKKIITIILGLTLLLSHGAKAQYYNISNFCIHSNPHGLNTNLEDFGSAAGAGWQVLASSSATPAWSPTGTIPFSFNFNGNSYTDYKVSTTGVLTFDLAAVTPPDSANSTIPSSSIPNNSILCWGISGHGANDQIYTKTFGTSPNRQHWIWFASYSYPECTSNPFTYWGIVLEETTNKIYIVDQRTSCGTNSPISLTIGIQINNSTAYSIGSNIAAIAENLTSADDNVWYEFGPGNLSGYDANTYNCSLNQYAPVNVPMNIIADMRNQGANSINSFTANYSVNGAAAVSSTVTASSPIASGECYNYTHPTAWTPSDAGNYTIKVWNSNLNGNPDQHPADDTITKMVTVVNSWPNHMVVVEEGTGTWCGWCPRGTVYMDSLAVVHPTTSIGIAVHNNDPMENPTYDAGIGSMTSGYPTILVDRKESADPANVFELYDKHINDFGFAHLTLLYTFNTINRQLVGYAAATMATTLSGNYRLAMVLTEDNLSGTSSGWNQANYYSQNQPLVGAGHDWQQEPNPVPASDMEYDHVARAIMGGFTGQANSLPTNLVDGSSYYKTFNYNVPTANNFSNMHVYLLLIDATQKIILNGCVGQFTATGVEELHSNVTEFSVYPNPATNDVLNLSLNSEKEQNMQIEITDLMGRIIVEQKNGKMYAGANNYSLSIQNIPSGMYFVNVITREGKISKKVIIE